MPAEWAPHEATWLAWPHNRDDWPGKYGPIPWVYGEILRKLLPHEDVNLIVRPPQPGAPGSKDAVRARAVLDKLNVPADLIESRLHFRPIDTNRMWARDFGPIFVHPDGDPSRRAIARFRFTGWAKYRNHKKTTKSPPRRPPSWTRT